MPEFVKDKAIRILNHQGIPSSMARVMVLGVAYKKDVADERESPALEIIRLLQQEEITVLYYDPLIRSLKEPLCMESAPLSAELLSSCHLVIIVTDHSAVDYQWVVDHASLVFDTRNATSNITDGREKITLL
jgi:UDP-N-acetyl-D-mannosaminuronate dehydrogenase